MAIPKITDVCADCEDNIPILQLSNDQAFNIVEGGSGSVTGGISLKDFGFPADGYTCIHLDIKVNFGEIEIFNNNLSSIGSPPVELTEGSQYVRGLIINIEYPILNDNGEEIDIVDKNVELWIQDSQLLEYKQYPLHNLFMLFTNPKSNEPSQLINKIKIINPNTLFEVKVKGLIIHGKTK